MKNYLTIFILFIVILPLKSQTYFSGGIFEDATWTKENSPYIITDDIAIYSGVTLTIEPGTIVKFNSGVYFYVRGVLNAIGNQTDSIKFISSSVSPSSTDWEGLDIENDKGGKVNASYVVGRHARYLFKISGNSSGEVLRVKNSHLFDNDNTIYGHDGYIEATTYIDSCLVENTNSLIFYANNLTLKNTTIRNCEKGAHCWDNSTNYVENCIFEYINVYTLRLSGGTSTVKNCIFRNNNVGVHPRPGLSVSHCSIENNQIGIEIDYSVTLTNYSFKCNKISNNSQYNVKHNYSYDMDFTNNCWDETNESNIASSIYDAYDNASLGIVNFKPFITDCNCVTNPDTVELNISICQGENYQGYNEAGTYYFNETATNGCDSVTKISLTVNELPTFSLGNDTTINSNDTLVISSDNVFDSYLWNTNVTTQSITVKGNEAGIGEHNYWLKVTDINGCVNSDTIIITVDESNFVDNFKRNSIKVYPNPSRDFINIEFDNKFNSSLLVEIYTINGTKVYKNSINGNSLNDQINLSNLPNGIYLLSIKTKEKIEKIKIVKE